MNTVQSLKQTENEELTILLCKVMIQQYCHVNILSNQHLSLAIYRTERIERFLEINLSRYTTLKETGIIFQQQSVRKELVINI